MAEPKVVPDFGSNAKAIDARQKWFKEHADHFTIVHRYQPITEVKTLEEARATAKRVYDALNNGQPLMIYAVYGPYDSWVENYDGKEVTKES